MAEFATLANNTSVKSRTKEPRNLRRWSRFTLRGLVLTIAVGGVCLGLWVDAAHRQRRAAVALRAQGFQVHYDYQHAADGRYLPDAERPVPDWLIRWFGEDYFCRVVAANAMPKVKANTTAESVALISRFPHLRFLNLEGLPVADAELQRIRKFKELEQLTLRTMTVNNDNVKVLHGLKNLTRLAVLDTEISVEGYEELRQALPGCEIRWSRGWRPSPEAQQAIADLARQNQELRTRRADRSLTDDERSELQRNIDLVLDRAGDPSDRWRAARVLGDLGHEDAIAPLAEVIFDREDNPEVRHACARAIGHIADPRSVEVLIDALTEDYIEVWITAYVSLFPLARGRFMGVDESCSRDWTLERRQEAQQKWRRWWSENKDQAPIHLHRPLTYRNLF